MANYNWVINHFLAVLPMGIEYLGNIIMQRENLIEMRKLEEKECEIEPPKLPKKLLKAILKLRSTKRGRNGRKHNYPKKNNKKTNKQDVILINFQDDVIKSQKQPYPLLFHKMHI